jgi:hypothetical protein
MSNNAFYREEIDIFGSTETEKLKVMNEFLLRK